MEKNVHVVANVFNSFIKLEFLQIKTKKKKIWHHAGYK